ncbi:MAG: ethanolamine utilization protein EutJ [Arachnia sp.]
MNVAATMDQAARALARPQRIDPGVPIKVGVDLGTAVTVIAVTDQAGRPLAVVSTVADVVRDGIVWDFAGAMDVIAALAQALEQSTGRHVGNAAVSVPPSTSRADHRAHRFVLEGVGIECDAVVDEPTAANAVLGIRDGAVVDIGGGTTGIALLRDGAVVSTIDQPSGGTHVSLVIAGAKKLDFAAAERLKVTSARHSELLPIVRPTLEKIATIVGEAIAGHQITQIHLVGGTAAFDGMAAIMTEVTGIPARVAPQPMLVTPLGVASWAHPLTQGVR